MLNIYKNKSFFNKIIAFVLLFIFSFAIFSQNSGIYFSSEKLKALLNTTPYMEMSTIGTEINEKSDLDNINKSAVALAGSYYLLGNQNYSSLSSITPIGTSSNPFKGEFNGNGFSITIKNIVSTQYHVGFFGYIRNATIKNLTIIIKNSPSASSAVHLGGICGYAVSSTFENCTFIYQGGSLGATNENLTNLGGICGYASGTSFTNCINNSSLDATGNPTNVGGICGFGGKVDNCINYGNISCDTSTTTYVGGLAGKCGYSNNSINYGNIDVVLQGKNLNGYVGGVAGSFFTNALSEVLVNFGLINTTTESSSVYSGGIAGYNENNSSFNKCANYGTLVVTKLSLTSNPNIYCGGLVGKSNVSVSFNDVYAQCNINVNKILSSCYLGGILGQGASDVEMQKTRTEVNFGNLGTIYSPMESSSYVSNVGNFIGKCSGVTYSDSSRNYVYKQNETFIEIKYSSGLKWESKYYHDGNELRTQDSCSPFIEKTSKFLLYDIAGGTNKYLTKTYRYDAYEVEDDWEDESNTIDYDNCVAYSFSADVKKLAGDNVYNPSTLYPSEYLVDVSGYQNNEIFLYNWWNAYDHLKYWREDDDSSEIRLTNSGEHWEQGVIIYDKTLDGSSTYEINDFLPLIINSLNFYPSYESVHLENGKGFNFKWLYPGGSYTNLGSPINGETIKMTRLYINEYDSSKLEWTEYNGSYGNETTYDSFDNIVLFANDRNSTKWESKAHLLGWIGLIMRYTEEDEIVIELPLIFAIPGTMNTSNIYQPVFRDMYFANYTLYRENVSSLLGADKGNGKTIDYYDRHDSHFGESRWVYNEYGKYMPIELFFMPD